MSGSLLDTSILIASGERLSDLPNDGAISVITLGELRGGVLLSRTESIRHLRDARLGAVRAAFLPLPVDESVADEYGRILSVARTAGRSAKASDLLIIATAAASGRRLYTLDLRQAALAEAAEVEVVAL